MLLAQIKSHLQRQQACSLFEIHKLFNVEPEIARDMLSVLVRKGRVRKCLKTPKCGTKCLKCDALSVEFYEWIN